MGLFSNLFESSGNEFKIGDKVRVKYRGQEGYIISLYMVSINDGEIVDSYEADELEKCW